MAPEKFHIKQIPKELRKQEVWSRRAYVEWVNDKLKAHYTNTLEFRNGAAYIQLFDSMFPGVIPMDDIKFSTNKEYDCYQNFRSLEEAFKKLGVDKNVDIDALSSGRHVESWAFLKWFKLFYDKNFDGKEYDPLKARKNAYMGFGKNVKDVKDDSLTTPRGKLKILSRTRSKSVAIKRGNLHGKSYSDEKDLNKVEKTCRSVECIHCKKDFEYGIHTPSSPLAVEKYDIERFNSNGKQIFFIKAGNRESDESELDLTYSANAISNATIANNSEVEEPSKDLVRSGNSQGDFEPKLSKNVNGSSETQSAQDSNINAVIVNKCQKYEEFGIRITENVQIRIERTNNAINDDENRRKMNLLIDRFLNYQWTERMAYFQTLAAVMKEEDQSKNPLN